MALLLLAGIGALAAGALGLALAGNGWDGVASAWASAARGASGASAGRPQRDTLGDMRQRELLALIGHHSHALTSAWGELERVQGTRPGVIPRGAAHALHLPPAVLAAIRQQAAAENVAAFTASIPGELWPAQRLQATWDRLSSDAAHTLAPHVHRARELLLSSAFAVPSWGRLASACIPAATPPRSPRQPAYGSTAHVAHTFWTRRVRGPALMHSALAAARAFACESAARVTTVAARAAPSVPSASSLGGAVLGCAWALGLIALVALVAGASVCAGRRWQRASRRAQSPATLTRAHRRCPLPCTVSPSGRSPTHRPLALVRLCSSMHHKLSSQPVDCEQQSTHFCADVCIATNAGFVPLGAHALVRPGAPVYLLCSTGVLYATEHTHHTYACRPVSMCAVELRHTFLVALIQGRGRVQGNSKEVTKTECVEESVL